MRIHFRTAATCLFLAAALPLAAFQFHHRQQLRQDRLVIDAELNAALEELERQKAALAELEQRNSELDAAERGAGNATLLSLMRERAAATESIVADAYQPRTLARAVAAEFDNSEMRALNREQIRNKEKAGSLAFVKILHLSPEKTDEYIDLRTEMESRKSDRTANLLHGTLSLDDALRQRDADYQESQTRLREVLGDDGYNFLQSIADEMRMKAAAGMISRVQDALGDNRLDASQSEQLQKLIKDQIAQTTLDEVDLFRPPSEWANLYDSHQQPVLAEAARFLTPAQLQMIRTLAAANFELQVNQAMLRRKSLGIK